MQAAPRDVVTPSMAAGLEELLREARLSLVATPSGAERCIDRALWLLTNNVDCSQEARQATTPAKGGLAPWQVRRLEALIEARLAETLRSTELAAAVRLSISHFTRAFTRSFGIPPHAYVVERRIAHAKYLIETTSSPLCEIALACGLADQAHLSRAFSRVAGHTPKSWRRNCTNHVTQARIVNERLMRQKASAPQAAL